MAEIINLNKVRKERVKAAKSALAKQNRLVFGRFKGAKALAEQQGAVEAARLEGHRLEDTDKA